MANWEIHPNICGPQNLFGKFQLTCGWAGVFQFCSLLLLSGHVGRKQRSSSSWPDDLSVFRPTVRTDDGLSLKSVRVYGLRLWLRSGLETKEVSPSNQRWFPFVQTNLTFLSKPPTVLSRSMVESSLFIRVSPAFSVYLYNSELPPPRVTIRAEKTREESGQTQSWLFIPEDRFAWGVIA